MNERIAVLRRMVSYGLEHGRSNLIVDLDLLDYLLKAEAAKTDLLNASQLLMAACCDTQRWTAKTAMKAAMAKATGGNS